MKSRLSVPVELICSVSGERTTPAVYLLAGKDNNSGHNPCFCFLYADANRFSCGRTVTLTSRIISSGYLVDEKLFPDQS